MTIDEMKAAIKRGIKFLDEKVPNWRRAITPDELDLGSCELCILGQIYGDFDNGRLGLSLGLSKAEEYGLYYESLNPGEIDRYYSHLTKLWKEALQ